MKVYGIDFTSKPKPRKPVTCLECELQGDLLTTGVLHLWDCFNDFESALRETGPWIAGVDFPFGQARKFIETIGWPTTWQGYVEYVGTLTREEFCEVMKAYKDGREAGDKEHRRKTDVITGSLSPQKLYGTPVGLMFYEGAPRLREANVTIPLLQQGDTDKIVVEAYPGVTARRFISRRSYKNDTKKKQTKEQHRARCDLLCHLQSRKLHDIYGFRIKAPSSLADDPTGDHLDALLCAIQAAWAWINRSQNYGIPNFADPLEGWISDPSECM